MSIAGANIQILILINVYLNPIIPKVLDDECLSLALNEFANLTFWWYRKLIAVIYVNASLTNFMKFLAGVVKKWCSSQTMPKEEIILASLIGVE